MFSSSTRQRIGWAETRYNQWRDLVKAFLAQENHNFTVFNPPTLITSSASPTSSSCPAIRGTVQTSTGSSSLPAFGPGTHPLIILDASFNPPTLAHLALLHKACQQTRQPYASLCLLSLNNADKGQLSVEEVARRLTLLEAALASSSSSSSPSPVQTIDPPPLLPYTGPIGIAIIHHARFLDKAVGLSQDPIPYFLPLGVPVSDVRPLRPLFILGADTVHRVLDPKYYDDPEVSLKRLASLSDIIIAPRPPVEVSQSDIQKRGYGLSIRPLDTSSIPPSVLSLSSTRVRAATSQDPSSLPEMVPSLTVPLILHPDHWTSGTLDNDHVIH
ncbi:MAG: hypothetical protein DHS80DRAFT_33961 [Piptocephalis tieghemiana]|nr:MAG: hypothetical protein DHS80DRAFT_33961 [Piptocephalis tieghemiana]